MVNSLIIGCSLLAAAAEPALSAAELKTYQDARAQAKRDPDANVRLALWCETHGLETERLKHLAIAVLSDPANAAARGLMGLIAYRGQWQRPEAVAERVQSDAELSAALADYNVRRATTPRTADAHWQLALWCEEKGLKAEATAHLTTVVQLDPHREVAWKRLGCKKHNGRWMTDAQVAVEKGGIEAQKRADRVWKPLLASWRGWLADKDKKKQAESEKALARVTDPRAVPAIWHVFCQGNANDQVRAVQILGQIDAPGASRAMAFLAAFSPSAEVRRKATETLKRRDAREFAKLLIDLIRKPIKYEVRPVGGPGSPGALFVEGKRFNVERLYAPPPPPTIAVLPGDSLVYDSTGLPAIERAAGYYRFVTNQNARVNGLQYQGLAPVDPAASQLVQEAHANPDNTPRRTAISTSRWRYQGTVYTFPVKPTDYDVSLDRATSRSGLVGMQIPVGQMMLEAQKSAMAAQEQLRNDVTMLDRLNGEIRDLNGRAVQVLAAVAGTDLGEDRETWRAWWVDMIGYAYVAPESKYTPTVVQNVPLAYLPQPIPAVGFYGPTLTETTSTNAFASLSPAYVKAFESQGFRRPMSCFGAGTLVHTLSGARPIETLQVGDQVLSQDTKTGSLSFQPILVVHHNPPSATFQINLGDETIVSSPFHRFWRTGKGWVMARELQPGDSIRTVGGHRIVNSVLDGTVQPVFNIDVAETKTFFAGKQGALVHDNGLPLPALEPFDAEPVLVVAEDDSPRSAR